MQDTSGYVLYRTPAPNLYRNPPRTQLAGSGVTLCTEKLAPQHTSSGLGLSHARGRKPVEDRPSARVLCLLSRYVSPIIISVVRALSLSLSLFSDLLSCMPPLSSPVQSESHRLTHPLTAPPVTYYRQQLVSLPRCLFTGNNFWRGFRSSRFLSASPPAPRPPRPR
jgi:hypothetical protein